MQVQLMWSSYIIYVTYMEVANMTDVDSPALYMTHAKIATRMWTCAFLLLSDVGLHMIHVVVGVPHLVKLIGCGKATNWMWSRETLCGMGKLDMENIIGCGERRI